MNQKSEQILAYLAKPEIMYDFQRVESLACYSDPNMLDFSKENELYQCYVHSQDKNPPIFSGKYEKEYQTGLREVVGVLKHCDRKESLRQYCRANARRLSCMDEDTYLTATMILGEPMMLIQRKKYEKEGKFDMCKAMKELIREAEKRGENKGTRLGEQQGRKEMQKQIAKKLYHKGKSIEEIAEWLDLPRKDVLVCLHPHAK